MIISWRIISDSSSQDTIAIIRKILNCLLGLYSNKDYFRSGVSFVISLPESRLPVFVAHSLGGMKLQWMCSGLFGSFLCYRVSVCYFVDGGGRGREMEPLKPPARAYMLGTVCLKFLHMQALREPMQKIFQDQDGLTTDCGRCSDNATKNYLETFADYKFWWHAYFRDCTSRSNLQSSNSSY